MHYKKTKTIFRYFITLRLRRTISSRNSEIRTDISIARATGLNIANYPQKAEEAWRLRKMCRIPESHTERGTECAELLCENRIRDDKLSKGIPIILGRVDRDRESRSSLV